ncbi:DUF3375 domain-containing protein [Arthrobacter sp. APC 3897]|uniref:DUF3375 domain-containing protein n=1 Tax=Arthrobacter sp. APC 3897 TaxID=3035204 RepID=UPI0025B3B766|nr:DUF3375 domain-containing protein [Arthrobacter sp. APC 3897]MDN3481400.1 DUF3375 domain-containing protein [Arthrobacter sp. APC 3897]
MSFIENTVARWAELQRLQATPGWKLTTANPWVLALFREAFGRTRPRIPLEEFHNMTDGFLRQLRISGVSLREDWTGKNYADDWVTRRFLARPRVDGRFVYELTESSVRFLSYLDGNTSDKTSLNSSRLATLLSRVENLAHETNPDPAARIAVLKEEVARREELIRDLESGEAPAPVDGDTAVEAAQDILDLAAALPADFKRMRDGLEKMLHALRQEMVESIAAKGLTMGEILEADRKLRNTSEGRTYEGFTAFLNDAEQQDRFRAAIAEVLERDFAEDLSPEDRQGLHRLISDMRGQATEIHRIYGRLSESMHTYVQSDEYRESVQLRQLIRTAETAIHKAPRSKRRTAVVPAPLLHGAAFESLGMVHLFNPADHAPPPKLPAPPSFTESDIHRSVRTPRANRRALRDAVTRAAGTRGTATVGEIFAELAPEDRHLNSIRALLSAALEAGSADFSPASRGGSTPAGLAAQPESITFTQIDGSERTALLPAVAVAKAPTHE